MRNYVGLDLLASSSAMAIDSHIKETARKGDYSNIENLSKKLRALSKKELDPTSLMMFAEVIWPDKEYLKKKNVDDVYPQINFLAKDLACFKEFSQERQEELRDVCVELSKKSMYYSNPYRIGLTV